jgi:hypothetical protein
MPAKKSRGPRFQGGDVPCVLKTDVATALSVHDLNPTVILFVVSILMFADAALYASSSSEKWGRILMLDSESTAFFHVLRENRRARYEIPFSAFPLGQRYLDAVF